MAHALARRGIVALVSCISTGFAHGAVADEALLHSRVAGALTRMHEWVGEGENGRRWRAYLMSDLVQHELSRAEFADARALAAPLARYQSQAKGLDRPRFAAVRTALADWQRNLAAEQTVNFSELATSAGADFSPITAAQVAAARQQLAQRVRELDDYLEGVGPKGQAWKRYLLWDQLQAQLEANAALDLGALARVYRRFRAIHEGLELPVFANVADALETYVNRANIAQAQDQSRQYSRQLNLLAEDLQAYESDPTDELALAIGPRLGFVDALGQAPRLYQAVRRRFGRPNLRARIAADLLGAAIAQDVHDTRQVADVILGTHIAGPARTSGRLSARTVSSGNGPARIDLVLSGVVHSDTVGRNGPVRIYSSAQTPFDSLKLVYFDKHGIREQSACTNATTCSEIHCIQPVRNGVGSGLIERIAWKRAAQQKGQAEAIAANRAEGRISQGFNARTLNLLADVQTNYDRNFRLPLIRRKEFPEYFDTRTTSEELALALLVASRSQLGASSAPPEPQGAYDLSLAVHQSAPINLASAWLSGYRLTDDWLRKRIQERGGDVPPELREDREPWSILFANQRPVSIAFNEGGFTATVRGLEFTSGDNAYGAMNITVRYTFESTDGGVVLRRQGDLEILPPGFTPGTDRLTAEQSALREVLIQRLGEVLKPEIRGEGIELPGEHSRVGKLLPVQATAADGWLSLGWNRARERTVVAHQPAATKVSPHRDLTIE